MADDSNSLRVRLVTPERILFEHTADAVELPAKNGYMEVLYGHAPLLAELGAGDVRIHGGTEGDEIYNVSWGFVEVLPDRVTILAQDALRPAEIDVERAQQKRDWHPRYQRAWFDRSRGKPRLHSFGQLGRRPSRDENKTRRQRLYSLKFGG